MGPETQRRTEKRNIGTENRTRTSHAIRLGVEEKKRVARRVASRGLGWCRTTGGGAARARAPTRDRARARSRLGFRRARAPRRPRAFPARGRWRAPRARICRLEASVYVAREEADEPCARSGRVRTCAESTLSKVKASPSAAKEATPDAERDDADDTADARDRGDDARARRGRLLLGSIEGSGGGPVPRLRGGGDQRRARVHRDVLRTRVGLKSDSYAERSRP